MLLDIRPDYLQIVQDILQKHVPQFEVWAFGSRAKWTAKEYSDLDLCIVSGKPLSFSVLGAMGEDFSESDLPWKVDVVDWATTSPSFRKIIERDRVVIQPAKEIFNQWGSITLKAACSLIADCPHSTPVWTTHGHVVIRNRNIKNGRLDLSERSYTDHEHFLHRIRRAKPQTGDLIFTREAPMGEVCMIPEGLECCVGQRQVLLRPNPSKVLPRFLLYAMQSTFVQNQIAWNEGTGSTVSNVRIPVLEAIQLPHPALAVQQYISDTLGAIDDKIALLRETNATLEAIAQALFKSWFVNFDPVRAKAEGIEPEGIPPEIVAIFPSEFEDSELGEIPKGWSVVSVSDVADVVKGKSYKSSELVDSETALVTLKSFTRGGGFRTDGFKGFSGSYKQEQVVKPGDCIVAYTDVTQQAEVIGRAAMVLPSPEHTTLVASLDVGIVRPKIEHLTTAFLYFLLRGERYVSHIFGYTSGTTVLHLAKDGLPTYQFVLPPASLLQKFEEVAIPMMEQMAGNYLQTIELASLRDTLLPRLMSGKLSLSTAGI